MAGVQDFYDGQDVFVTGGTGFLGKVLIEKITRSCVGIRNIYILMRPKKGKNMEERLEDIINLPLFKRIRAECPEHLKKLKVVAGDFMKLQLGLSDSDRKMLEENVSIVFNSAATVKFDDPLTYATILNTRGTREMMMIARNMKKLKVLVHISTSYVNCDKEIVEEKVYPLHVDWRQIINMVETLDEHTINILTPKILAGLPNTYILSKAMGEQVVKDLGGDIPTVIVRPSIVVATFDDPFSGWIDNFNGPIGILVAGGKGVVHVSYGLPQAVMDLIPADIVIKILVVSAWHAAKCGVAPEPYVFHGTSGRRKRITLKKLIEAGKQSNKETPFESIIWKDCALATDSKFRYYCRLIYAQVIPAFLLDYIIKRAGHQPFLLRLQRRIHTAQIAIYYFVSNTWLFKNDGLFKLRSLLPENEKADFSTEDIEYVEDIELFRKFMLGARHYLLKEDPNTIPKCRVHKQRLEWVYRFAFAAVYGSMGWFAYNSEFVNRKLHNIFYGDIC